MSLILVSSACPAFADLRAETEVLVLALDPMQLCTDPLEMALGFASHTELRIQSRQSRFNI